MFKLVMRRKRICKKMLEKILQVQIRDIKYLEEEKTIKNRYEGKGIRLDVYLEDDAGTVYDVEMQVRKPSKAVLARRVRYYQAMIDSSLLDLGFDYDELRDSIIIFICPFDPFGKGWHIYEFDTTCKRDRELNFPDGLRRIFLNTKGTGDDVNEDVKAFLNYVNGIVSDDAFVREIEEEIHELKLMEEERKNYMTFKTQIDEEKRASFKEGEAKGREEGRTEGESRLQTLIRKLLAAKRFDDVEKVTDTKKLAALYAEFGM